MASVAVFAVVALVSSLIVIGQLVDRAGAASTGAPDRSEAPVTVSAALRCPRAGCDARGARRVDVARRHAAALQARIERRVALQAQRLRARSSRQAAVAARNDARRQARVGARAERVASRPRARADLRLRPPRAPRADARRHR